METNEPSFAFSYPVGDDRRNEFGHNNEVMVRSLQSFNVIATFNFRTMYRIPQSLCISPDNSTLACGCGDVYIWNMHTGIEECTLQVSGHVLFLEYSKMGSRMLTLSEGDCSVWELAARAKVPFVSVGYWSHAHFCLHDSSIVCVSETLSESEGDERNCVQLWNIGSSVCTFEFDGLEHQFEGGLGSYIQSTHINSSSTHMAAGCNGGSSWMFCLRSQTCTLLTHHRDNVVGSVRFSPDDSKLLLLYTWPSELEMWDLERASSIFLIKSPLGPDKVMICPTFTPDGEKIVLSFDFGF